MPRVFIPAGAWRPDDQALRNNGLRRAYGVLPFGEAGYIPAPGFATAKSSLLAADDPLGGYIHSNASGDFYYYGDSTGLYEIDLLGPTEAPRGSGYFFGTGGSSAPSTQDAWRFLSYGDNIVATNFWDPVQYVAGPPGAFGAMITSTFKPQFRFAISIRQNLFGLYCFLPATYDGIPAGTHPQLGVWSQNDNIRAFGSENVDPALVGAGYQQFIGGDLGAILAAHGAGDYGLAFQEKGITRIDGPPYEFRVIDRNDTTSYPYSIQSYRGDVYFWGAGGPAVLRGGEGPAVSLADGVLLRTLAAEPEVSSGFSEIERENSEDTCRAIGCVVDRVNGYVRWTILPRADSYIVDSVASTPVKASGACLDYHVASGRFSISPLAPHGTAGVVAQAFYPVARHPDFGSPWGPHRTVYWIEQTYNAAGLVDYALRLFTMNTSNLPSMEIKTGLQQVWQEGTARILRVRPVWSRGAGGSAVSQEVRIGVTNNPHGGVPTQLGPFSEQDEHGWIACQDMPATDFAEIAVLIDPNATGDARYITEIEGFEVEYSQGSAYGA